MAEGRCTTETERRDVEAIDLPVPDESGFRYWSVRDVAALARRSGLNAATCDPVRGPIVIWLRTMTGTKRWTFVDSMSALNFVRGWIAAIELA